MRDIVEKSVSPASSFIKTETFDPMHGTQVLHIRIDSKDITTLIKEPLAPTHAGLKAMVAKECSCVKCLKRLCKFFTRQTTMPS